MKCHRINTTALPGEAVWAACASICLLHTCSIGSKETERGRWLCLSLSREDSYPLGGFILQKSNGIGLTPTQNQSGEDVRVHTHKRFWHPGRQYQEKSKSQQQLCALYPMWFWVPPVP